MNLAVHLIIYNLIASVWLYGTLAVNPRMWLHRMPPEVRQKVPEKTPQERKQFVVAALPFLLLILGYPLVYTWLADLDLAGAFLSLVAFYAGFAVWDTLVLDLLIFCLITPGFIIIPGTRRSDYRNTRYHLVSGSKGVVMGLVAAGVLAVLLEFIQGLLA